MMIEKLSFKIFISITTIVVTLLCVEFGTRLYLSVFRDLTFKNHLEFRMSVPKPYRNSQYDVKKFTSSTFGQMDWETPEDTSLVIPRDFKTEYINIKDGKRSTTLQPLYYKNVIYLFGGSTMFCSEVPDEYTIASYFQDLANKEFPNRYIVENYGASSVISAQELERLKTINLREGDMVVFFNGANDVIQSIYNNDPEGYIVGKNNKIVRETGSVRAFFLKIHPVLGKYSTFVSYFLDPFERKYKPSHMNDSSHVESLTNSMEKNYARNIIEADNYTRDKGAIFFHFLQPTIFSGNNATTYENNLRSNPYLIGVGIEDAMEIGYPKLTGMVSDFRSIHNIYSYDITKLFDGRASNHELFLDWVHVSEEGNRMIAEKLFKEMIKTGEL